MTTNVCVVGPSRAEIFDKSLPEGKHMFVFVGGRPYHVGHGCYPAPHRPHRHPCHQGPAPSLLRSPSLGRRRPGSRAGLQPPAPGVEASSRRLLPGPVPGGRRHGLRGARQRGCPLGDQTLLRGVVRGSKTQEGRDGGRFSSPQEGPPAGALLPRDVSPRRRAAAYPRGRGIRPAGRCAWAERFLIRRRASAP